MRGALRILATAAALASAAAWAQSPSAQGRDIFLRADKGNCIACHQVPEGAGPSTRADLGPRLEGARMRALGKAKVREIIVDPTLANPDTVMPPYGRHHILSDAEIDRLVDYLNALP